MKLVLAAAVAALGATAVGAYAQQGNVMFIHHGGPEMNIDANHDGWITRAEAAAAADRMFDELDTNHDGRLTDADRPARQEDLDVQLVGPEGLAAPDESNCTRTANGNRVIVMCRDEPGHDGQRVERRVIVRNGDHTAPRADAGRHVEREVTIVTNDGGDDDDVVAPEPPESPAAPRPPRAPHPPHPPMFMMLMANSDEMDTNRDGAISREEFRAQQLRFFDASDANGDGRIRFEPPPEPPMPPLPPVPPVAGVAPTPDVTPVPPAPPVAPRAPR